MSHERLLDYLNQRRIIYRRLPISDKPTACFDWGYFYEDGTHECYDLFRSKATLKDFFMSEQLFIEPYYGQLSADIKMKNCMAENWF